MCVRTGSVLRGGVWGWEGGGGELKGEGDIAYALKQGCGITNACTWVIHPWQPHKRSCLLQSVGIRKR